MRPAGAGASFLDLLVSLAVLLIGVIAIAGYFPLSIRAANEAADLSLAAMLAQRKAEEVRRDNDQLSNLMNQIAGINSPTAPAPFANTPHLSYSFCGESVMNPGEDPDTPRVIILYSASYRPSQDVIFELKFRQ